MQAISAAIFTATKPSKAKCNHMNSCVLIMHRNHWILIKRNATNVDMLLTKQFLMRTDSQVPLELEQGVFLVNALKRLIKLATI